MLLAEATVSLQALIGVGVALAAVVGVAVSFRLFMYRIDRLEEKELKRDEEHAAVERDVRAIELKMAKQAGAERERRGQSIDDTRTFTGRDRQ